jgi:hypothetical protein
MCAGFSGAAGLALSRFVEALRNHCQNFSRGAHIRRARPAQRLGHRPFDGSRRIPGKDHGARIEPQSRAPAVARIPLTLEKPSRDETTENPGERAGMQPNDVCQFPCRQARKLADYSKYQSLGAGDSEFGFHPLGHFLEPVLERPEQSHEVQDGIELVLGVWRDVTRRHSARIIPRPLSRLRR